MEMKRDRSHPLDFSSQSAESSIRKGSETLTDEEVTLAEIQTVPSYRTWTRQQVIPCLLIYLGMITQILCLMMVGPGLLDLQLVTQTTIEQASWFLSARAAGALVGSIILSKTMETQYYWFQLSAALILSGVAFIIIPWVANFPAVIVLFVLMGCGMGYFLTGGMLSLYSIWTDRKDSVSWINGGQVMLLVGGIAGPLIVRPFFASPTPNPTTNLTSTIAPDQSSTELFVTSDNDLTNTTFDLQDIFPDPSRDPLPSGSETYIMYAFLIGGLTVIVTGGAFILAYFKLDKIKFQVRNPTEGGPKTKLRLLPLKIGIVIVLFMFHVMIAILVRTFAAYIVTFTVNYMNWTKEKGSLLTSIVFIESLISKAVCIFLVRVIKTEIQLFVGCFINIIGAGLLLFLINMDDSVIWVCTLIIAIGDSNITATILAWTDKYVGIRGIIGALYNIGGTVGEIAAAPLVGWLFQEVSYEAFLYLLSICTIATLVFMIMLQFMGMRYQTLVKIYDSEEKDDNETEPLISKSSKA